MGKTFRRGGPAFDIHHERAAHAWYAPGDTIIGHVSRSSPLVSPTAIVKITLCGRTKSKIVVSRSNNQRSYYRGRFDVINEHAHLQTIYQGPIHIATEAGAATGPAVWPFAIDIPRTCCRLLRPPPSNQSYLPLNPETVTASPLPDSFTMDHPGWGTNREGFVEYFLKATISFTQGGHHRTDDAFLPINIRTGDPNPPIADFKLRRSRHVASASTFHLLPGMDDAELSFSQKRQEFMGSSKVPRIGGQLEIDIPQVLQLENRNPVHIQMRFVPDPKMTSSGMRGIPAKIALRSMSATITSYTTVLCDGSFSPHHASDDTETNLHIWPPASSGGPTEPLYIPCTDEWPPIDIGERVGFRIPDYLCRRIPGKPIRELLSPDFVTYNIKHWHTVTFKVVVVAAGQDIKTSVNGKLKILPPTEAAPSTQAGSSGAQQQEEEAPPPAFQGRSESWIHPPAEADAPPTFAEVQKDDLIRKSFDGRGEGETSQRGQASKAEGA
jgi:hypothetical protein